ncbi:MAG: flagellar biosynthesis protein FlhA [Candidatus Eremiobacterota bacterium]
MKKGFNDILFAIIVISIVVIMIIPIPVVILDLLIALNIALALTILLVGMYIREPLELSIFPSLLLFTTLFRLALNISATRHILLHAYAGKLIESFGNFVVGGNYVVGIVIFIIIVVVQNVVIISGSQRVAEVAARFTLDAMPGKQMSIDADLGAGIITEQQAVERRQKLQREADFYGAMDGASKFVKGDAIAAIIIICVNIVAGYIIGVLQLKMPLDKALGIYVLLTVGEGIVSQLPALLISTATGVVVTRVASEGNLGEEIGTKLLAYPKAIYIVSGLLLFFVLIPGLPKLPFLTMGLAAGFLAYNIDRKKKVAALVPRVEEEGPPPPSKEEEVMALLDIDPIELEFGYGLIPLVDKEQGGDLLERVSTLRRQCALDLGIIIPLIRIRDNIRLKPSGYSIKIYDIEIASGEVMVGRLMALNPGAVDEPVDGIKTKEPSFGLPATWITKAQQIEAEAKGYTVIDPTSVIVTHLTETIKSHAPDILTREQTKILVDNIKKNNPVVVDEIIPEVMNIGEVQKILQNLLRERVPIRNLLLILETIADRAAANKNTDMLTEYARQALSRVICQQHQRDGALTVLTVDPQIERTIQDLASKSQADPYSVVDPRWLQKFYNSLLKEIEKISQEGIQPIILCTSGARVHLKRLIERVLPNVAVISFSEVIPEVRVEARSMVSIEEGQKNVIINA